MFVEIIGSSPSPIAAPAVEPLTATVVPATTTPSASVATQRIHRPRRPCNPTTPCSSIRHRTC